MSNIWLAFILTTFAGLSTGIGSFIAFWAKRSNYRFLSVATGFSAGVMLYVSFVEILFEGAETLTFIYGEKLGNWINVAAFFGGILLIGLVDNLIPAAENPHETHDESETAPLRDPTAPLPDWAPCVAYKATGEATAQATGEASATGGAATAEAGTPTGAATPAGGDDFGIHDHSPRSGSLMRTGLFTALAIGIHNFPEGLVTFLAVLEDPKLGVAVAIAIALHNIPEGVSVSVPIFYATGDRRKAFIYSFLSGLAEPVGAGIGYLILRIFFAGDGGAFPPQVTGIMFAAVAGIMVYISIDELLPTSRAYGKGHDSIFGLVAGMAVMALSLLLLM